MGNQNVVAETQVNQTQKEREAKCCPSKQHKERVVRGERVPYPKRLPFSAIGVALIVAGLYEEAAFWLHC